MRRTSRAMLTAGFVALGVSAIPVNAFADTTGEGGVLAGNQVNAPISAPIDVTGNAVSVLGISQAQSKGGATVKQNGNGNGGQQTSGKGGVGSGNQVDAPISIPVNACGNAVAVLGIAQAGCTGGATVKNPGGGDNGGGGSVSRTGRQAANGNGNGGQVTDGSGGVLAGNQVKAPISVPVNVCGNGVAVIGQAVAGCEGGAKVKGGSGTGANQQTSGAGGVLSGNQADVPISVPVNVCGNAVGNAVASCDGGATVKNAGQGTGQQTTSGAGGVLSGNQANIPISIPVNVCGNAAAVIGQAGAACEGGAKVVGGSGGGEQTTSGAGGVLSGNQANIPISIPVNVCGNAVAVIGQATGSCTGGASVKNGGTGTGQQTTSGAGGVGSGNQADVPVTAPVDVCGNGAAVIGLASPSPDCDGPGTGSPSPAPSPSYRTSGTAPRPAAPIAPPAVGGGSGLLDGLGAPGLPVQNQRTAGAPLAGDGSPLSLLDTRALPVLNAASQPGAPVALPKAGAQRVRQDGGTPVSLPVPVKPVVPAGAQAVQAPKATDELGQVRHVAATETISPATKSGATLLAAVSGLLAAAAGVTVLARRIRVGRR
ncbi:chaplin family protein [Actinomadura sp. WMMA1423]|uniref:chaplin family protein n=1 Tax=Actinomadura sp. WMMA1423 TaxID=2591108 RepID=UPI0011462598|nr:chaplin family protein [Actinomadura sp. WMMA1423]